MPVEFTINEEETRKVFKEIESPMNLDDFDGIPVTQTNKINGLKVRRGKDFDQYRTPGQMPPSNADVLNGGLGIGTVVRVDSSGAGEYFKDWIQVDWNNGQKWWYRAGNENNTPKGKDRYDLYVVE